MGLVGEGSPIDDARAMRGLLADEIRGVERRAQSRYRYLHWACTCHNDIGGLSETAKGFHRTMLLDGYWKRDLEREAKRLRFWSARIPASGFGKVRHRVNRSLLLSAAIIRKIIEDESSALKACKDQEWEPPALPVLHYKVPVKKCELVVDPLVVSVSKAFSEDYDFQNAEEVELTLKQVCNQIIHSYTWGVFSGTKGSHASILLASDYDKEKFVYWLRLDDWISTVEFVAANCNIESV